MKKKDNLKKFLCNTINLLFISLLFEPNIFVKYRYINYIYIFGGVFVFFITFLKMIRLGKISKFTKILIYYRFFITSITIIKGGDIFKCGYYSLIEISLSFIYEIYFNKNLQYKIIKMINLIFSVYLVINIVTLYIFPNGIINGLYFLGFRTRFTEYSFGCIILSTLLLFSKNIKKRNYLFNLIISLSNIIIPKVSTAIIGLIVLLLFYIFLNFVNRKNFINPSFILYFALFITIMIVFFRVQNIFSFLIVDILHKDITLTNRIFLWNNSFNLIFDKNIIVGHGMPDSGNFVPFYGYGSLLYQAHCQLLQCLYESGLFGTILFYSLFNVVLNQIKKLQNFKVRNFILASIFSILVMMITEVLGYYLPIYSILLSFYFLLLKQKKEETYNEG